MFINVLVPPRWVLDPSRPQRRCNRRIQNKLHSFRELSSLSCHHARSPKRNRKRIKRHIRFERPPRKRVYTNARLIRRNRKRTKAHVRFQIRPHSVQHLTPRRSITRVARRMSPRTFGVSTLEHHVLSQSGGLFEQPSSSSKCQDAPPRLA